MKSRFTFKPGSHCITIYIWAERIREVYCFRNTSLKCFEYKCDFLAKLKWTEIGNENSKKEIVYMIRTFGMRIYAQTRDFCQNTT
jgi:hypothetical protein